MAAIELCSGTASRTRASRALRLRSPRETPLRSDTDVLLLRVGSEPEQRIRRTSSHPEPTRKKRLTMPPSGRRRMRGERLFLEPVSRKAMPVQFCCCGLVETACRSHAHHPEASADRAVGSAHYPVALLAVTLVVARAREAVHQPPVMPPDCSRQYAAVQASERLP